MHTLEVKFRCAKKARFSRLFLIFSPSFAPVLLLLWMPHTEASASVWGSVPCRSSFSASLETKKQLHHFYLPLADKKTGTSGWPHLPFFASAQKGRCPR